MAKPLNERIASARATDRVTITDLDALITEASSERDRLASIVAQETTESIRFELTEDDREIAAAKAERAKRSHAAICAAIDELTEKLAAKRQNENRKAVEAERDALKAERDALAERLRNEWPEIEAKIVELLTEIKLNDERLSTTFGGLIEPSAEAVARKVPGNFWNGASQVRRLTEIRLPSFNGTDLAWPPRQGINLDRSHQAYLKQREAMLAERARWKRYVVEPGVDGERVIIETQAGQREIYRNPVIAKLTEELVLAARKAGLRVEPASENLTLGGPVSAASF